MPTARRAVTSTRLPSRTALGDWRTARWRSFTIRVSRGGARGFCRRFLERIDGTVTITLQDVRLVAGPIVFSMKSITVGLYFGLRLVWFDAARRV